MNRHVRRAAISAAAASALAASLAATSGATERTPPASFQPVPAGTHVKLTLLTYLPAAFSTGTATLDQLLAGFERLHPNISVKVESTFPTLPAVQQDEAAGATPDVVQGTFDGWRYLVSGLGAVDLTTTFGPAALAAEWGGPFPYATPVTRLAEEGGQVYGVPWTLSTPVLFYNADLFKKAGLDPAKPPATWAQLRVDALKIKKATGADGLANACIGEGPAEGDWCLQAILDSAGGHALGANGTRLTFDSAANRKALDEMQLLAKEGVMPNLTSTQVSQEWATNKLAMTINTSAVQSLLLSEAHGGGFTMLDARLPSFGTAPSAPTNSGSALFILSKRPVAQRAAWELVSYLTSPKSMTTITEDIGYPPLRPGLATSPSYLATWRHTNGLVKVNLDQLQRLVPYQGYPGANYSQIVTTLANAATTVTFDGGNASSVLAAAQSTATKLLP